MKKSKKPKYYVAQYGANPLSNNPYLQDDAMYSGANENLPDLNPRNTPDTGNVGALPTYTVTKKKSLHLNPEPTLNPLFNGINALATGATAIGGAINTVQAQKQELAQYLKAINPTHYENMERYGLNDNPAYTKYGGAVKYQVGGEPGQLTSLEPLTPSTKAVVVPPKTTGTRPKKSTAPAAFKQSQGDEYTIGWNKDFPMAGGKVKDAVYSAAKQTGLDPSVLYGSAMQEGMNKAIFKPDDISESYGSWAEKNVDKAKQFPVDGFYNYGLDTFGGNYKELQKKGYLPEGFDKRFTTFDALNEKKQKVSSAAFASDADALTAKAAMMRNTQDQVNAYAKNNNINLSDDARNFFTVAGYNGGFGNAKGMIDTYNKKGYLKDDAFLKDSFVPGKGEYKQLIDNNRPRITNAQRLKKQGLFNDFTKMQTGGDITQTDGLPSRQGANVEAEKGEAFTNSQGDVMQVANDAPTHEQGGVMLPDVHRVLENTSNLRKDQNSKYLKLEPKQIKGITGLDTTKSMSHAEALVKANENNEALRSKIVKKIELAGSTGNVDSYAENAIKLNLEHFKSIPTKQELFDKLFLHQEFVKKTVGIPTGEEKKNGGLSREKDRGSDSKPYPSVKSGDFAGGDRSYPIPTKADAVDALRLAGLHGRSDVKAKVYAKYPELKKAQVGLETVPNGEDLNDWTYQDGKFFKKNSDLDPNTLNPATGMPMSAGTSNTPQEGDIPVVDGRGRATRQRINTTDLTTTNPNETKTNISTDSWTDPQGTGTTVSSPTPSSQNLSTGIKNNIDLKKQPESQFNEPLRWYDIASPVNAFLSSVERTGEKYNPVQFNQLRYKLLDPTAALNQNTADFKAAIETVQNTSPNNAGVAMANIANLTAQKYSFNNQVLGNYENQNSQIKNNEILYNTQVRDKQSVADQQAREVFEEKVLTGKAKQEEQKLTALDSLYKTIAENRALNRNGNLMMKFSRAFDQYGNYNGYQTKFQVNPQFGMNSAPTGAPTGKAGSTAAGGIQNIKPGQSYYNRKTGKTYYFNGTTMTER